MGIGLHYEAQMGHDWMDDLLYPRYPRVFVLPSFVFVLEGESGKKKFVHVWTSARPRMKSSR